MADLPEKQQPEAPLFERVVSILEQSRQNVVRSVNSNMVVAYWLIGREIVEAVQAGEQRADYGKQVLEDLSKNLNQLYGKGFSTTNLKYFRTFYQTYSNRLNEIRHLPGDEFTFLQKKSTIQQPTGVKSNEIPIRHLPGGELVPRWGPNSKIQQKLFPSGRELAEIDAEKQHPSGVESMPAFNPQLTWSHYRAIMRVKDENARDFYENEAVECGWSKSQLERQISTQYYQRLISTKGQEGLLPAKRDRLAGETQDAATILKSPYILEFLDLPDSPALHEKDLEQAIINNLQSFLLEMGKGFSFVARQKHIRFDDEDFYIDLVFYNFQLKCFVLIDLKIGKLTHKDVGQMDGYVRLYEERFKVVGDNPTIGLILCSDKSEAVAKYSVLNEGKQIFASKYLNFLPSEEELQRELMHERRLLEEHKDFSNDK